MKIKILLCAALTALTNIGFANLSFVSTLDGDGILTASEFSITVNQAITPSIPGGDGIVVYQDAYNSFSDSLQFVDGAFGNAPILNQLDQTVGSWAIALGTQSTQNDVSDTDFTLWFEVTSTWNVGDTIKFTEYSEAIAGDNWWPTNSAPFDILIADGNRNAINTTVVPEPSIAGLLAGTLAFCVALRRRYKR